MNNVLGAFEAEGTMDPKLEMALNAALIIVFLGGNLFWLTKAFPKKAE